MTKDVCGCGRTVLEIVESLKAIQDIDKTLQTVPSEERYTRLTEGMKAIRDLFHRNFNTWLAGLETECHLSKGVVDKVAIEAKQDIDKAVSTLREELIKCAGMVW